MKYLFLLSEKFYRFIEWEWSTLKNLRRTKRKNFFLRGSFALFSLFSVLFLIFSPPIAFGLLFGEGLKFSTFFIWIWILNFKFFWNDQLISSKLQIHFFSSLGNLPSQTTFCQIQHYEQLLNLNNPQVLKKNSILLPMVVQYS